jgi:hypothetical protein
MKSKKEVICFEEANATKKSVPRLFLPSQPLFLYFFRKFRVFPVCFGLFKVCFKTVCFGCFASIPNQMFRFEPKHAEDQPKQFDRESMYFGIFQKSLGCFGSFRNSSVCFGCFDIGSKQTETQQNQILFRFVSVRTEFFFVSRTPYIRLNFSVC